MAALVHAADIQDRDGGVLLMATLFGMYPFLLKLYADAGYGGPKFQQGMARVCRKVNVEIVRRCDAGKFVVLPKRWIVERTIAWLNRCRRLSKDCECVNRNALAFLKWHQCDGCSDGSAKADNDLGPNLSVSALGLDNRQRLDPISSPYSTRRRSGARRWPALTRAAEPPASSRLSGPSERMAS